MGFFTGPTLLLLMTLSLFSAEETDYLEVLYPQSAFFVYSGSSSTLSCEAKYDFIRCGLLHVVWQKNDENTKKSSELTDPNRYVTTVNETIIAGNMRRRQVRTDILSVRGKDQGQYQCRAQCEAGETAMGHYITIKVRERP